MRAAVRMASIPALLAAFLSCATNQLADYHFAGESIRISVDAAPPSAIDASYHVTIDPSDPVTTIVSIGTSVAKAEQVAIAERKLAVATRSLDVETIVRDEMIEFYTDAIGMRVEEDPGRTDFSLRVFVDEYGISAGSWSSSVEFELNGQAELYDSRNGIRVWRRGLRASRTVSPSFFGLPAPAGNVVSAVMLAELSEEEIASGLERLARDAARQLSRQFERDLYHAHRDR